MNEIGKCAIIKDKESIYFGEWGVVKAIDDDLLYYIAIANDSKSLPVFTRDQIRIKRKIVK